MRLHRHEGIASFLRYAREYLERNEALNNLILGLATRIKNDPTYHEEVYLATITDHGEIVLAALMTVPYKLLVYGESSISKEISEILVEDLLKGGYQIPGVLGPREVAKQVGERWAKHIPSEVELRMPMGVYELREVNQVVIGEGTLRLAGEDDLHLVAEGILALSQETDPDQELDLERCYHVARAGFQRNSIYVWEHLGQAVSMATKARPTLKGVSVNMVYTPENFRRKGYATSCVASLSQLLLDEGYEFCSLFTNLNNPTSNSIYQKIGYKPVGYFYDYAIRPKES